MVPPPQPVLAGDPSLHLSVLGRFALLHAGSPLRVTGAGQRLLALLALHQHPVRRSTVAGWLWADSDEQHATWSLRATLHRLPHPDGRPLVSAPGDHLALDPDVRVDLRDLVDRATAFLGSPDEQHDDDLAVQHVRALEQDVLPGWYDDWVVLERERYRQLRLHALEQLARRLVDRGRYALAVHAGLAAVHAEPLRESAHRIVIEAHLAEGNVGEAVRQYQRCRQHLGHELGIEPSRELTALVPDGARTRPRPRTPRRR